jgi:hypothetical protein
MTDEKQQSKVWYRFEDYLESQGYVDQWGEYVSTGSKVRVHIYELTIMHRTPKGIVIRDKTGNRRFICDSWYKRYACATKEQALESFIARKKKQHSIYKKKAHNAEKAILEAKRIMGCPTHTETLI